MVISVLVAIEYRFIDRNAFLKIGFIFLLGFLFRLVKIVLARDENISTVIATLLGTVSIFLIIWILFAERIKGFMSKVHESQVQLKRSEQKNSLIVNSAYDIIFTLDETGKFTSINTEAESLLGNQKGIFLGSRFEKLLVPESRRNFLELFNRVARADTQNPHSLEVELSIGTGESAFLEMKLLNTRGVSELPSIYCVARDITQQRKAEQNLIKYQHQLRALSSQLSLTEARERKQIASELHDRIGHALVMIKMNLLKISNGHNDHSNEKSLLQTLDFTEQVIENIRSLTFELASPLLYELGLSPALEQLAEKMQDEHGIMTSFVSNIGDNLPSTEVSILLYQTVRELLFNVVKHAKASNVQISVTKERDNLLIVVHDDGIGFTISSQLPENDYKLGIGLFSARERLNYLGGNIKMESRPGKGTCATLMVPLPNKG